MGSGASKRYSGDGGTAVVDAADALPQRRPSVRIASLFQHETVATDTLPQRLFERRPSAPQISTKVHIALEEMQPDSPISPKSGGYSNEGDVMPVLATEKDLLEVYPSQSFDLTLYASVAGLRPGGQMELMNFNQAANGLNGLTGRCRSFDSTNSVWLIILDDKREVRVLPLRFKPSDSSEEAVLYKGRMTYGINLADVWANSDFNVSVKERRKAEVIEGRKHSKELRDPMSPTSVVESDPRSPTTPFSDPMSPAGSDPMSPGSASTPGMVRRQSTLKRRGSTISAAQPSADGVAIAEPSAGFQAGDQVTSRDDRLLGVGVIQGAGVKPGSFLVQFENSEHVRSVDYRRLKRMGSRQSSRQPSKQRATAVMPSRRSTVQ